MPLALVAPRRVFTRVEDVGAYGWALAWLLATITLIGFAMVETGLIDREVDRRVQGKIAQIEKAQVDVVELSTLSKLIEEAKQEGEFERMMTRVAVIGVSPLVMLATILLIPAALYGLVALTGRKPEWHTLVTICVFASFASVLGELTRLALMLKYQTLDVTTSLAVLARTGDWTSDLPRQAAAALSAALGAVDPFVIWFWIVMAVGLSTTSQLRGWKAWATCFGFWMVAAGVKAAAALAAGAGAGPAAV